MNGIQQRSGFIAMALQPTRKTVTECIEGTPFPTVLSTYKPCDDIGGPALGLYLIKIEDVGSICRLAQGTRF